MRGGRVEGGSGGFGLVGDVYEYALSFGFLMSAFFDAVSNIIVYISPMRSRHHVWMGYAVVFM